MQPYLSFVLGDGVQTGQGWLRWWAQVGAGGRAWGVGVRGRSAGDWV